MNMLLVTLLLLSLALLEVVVTFHISIVGNRCSAASSLRSSSSPSALFAKEVKKDRARYKINHRRGRTVKRIFRGLPKRRPNYFNLSDDDYMSHHHVITEDDNSASSPTSTTATTTMTTTTTVNGASIYQPIPIPTEYISVIRECSLTNISDNKLGIYHIKGIIPVFLVQQLISRKRLLDDLKADGGLYPGGFRPGEFPETAIYELRQAQIIYYIASTVMMMLAKNGIALCNKNNELVHLATKTILKPFVTSTRRASDLAQRAYFLKESDEFEFEIDVFGRKIGREIQLSQVPYTPKKQSKPLKHNRKWRKMNYNSSTACASTMKEETYHEVKEEEDIPPITAQVDHSNTDATVEGQLVGSHDMAHIVNPNTGAVSASSPKAQRRSKKDVVSSNEAVQKKTRGRKPRAQPSAIVKEATNVQPNS